MKDLSTIQWGWVKDPEDKRDFPAQKLIFAEMPLPTNYFAWPDTPIYNQGSNPSCVGFCCAGVKSDEEYLQHRGKYLFDGQWLYNECKKIDGMPNVAGTNLRVALRILQQEGIKQLVLPCKRREPDSFWEIGSYFRLANDSIDEFIKQVLVQYGSIALGSTWYRSWMSVGEVFPRPDTPNGAHAYRLCGWRGDDPTGWVIVNSWGKLLWGKAGIAIMPYDMFKAVVLDGGSDIWKLVDK
jgi:hypothetical protein